MLKRMLLVVGVMAVAVGSTGAQAGIVGGEPYVEIWTDRGTGGVYSPGEQMDVYMRPAFDCFVIVYDIDTDGYLKLLFPYDSRDDGFVRGGQIYRLGMGGYGGYYVAGPSGVEYVHVLASFQPFRPVYWHGQAGYEAYAFDVSWKGFGDYWGCALPPRVYGDPYVAMQSVNEFICYDALEAGIAFADFTYFYVEHRVSYPRYLCYDCHGYRPAFHPYVDVCSGFHISFVACDPCYTPCSWWWWCSPKRVYCGPIYVCDAKKPCKKYPSRYKWRTRCDSYCGSGGGTSYGDYYKERVRPGGGRTGEVVRVRPERETGERYLYSRKESREALRDREAKVVSPGWAEVKRMPARIESPTSRGSTETTRSREKSLARRSPKVETRKAEDSNSWAKLVKVVKRAIEREEGEKGRSRTASKDSRVTEGKKSKQEPRREVAKVQASSQRKSEERSSGASSKSRKVAPRARTQSKGKSQSTRRRVSK